MIAVPGAILVLNAGSSSLKWARFGSGADGLVQLASGQAEVNDPTPEAFACALDGVMRQATSQATPLVAVGHRVVHGGPQFGDPVRVDAALLDALSALSPLAPLHQPNCIAPIRRLLATDPSLPQVACFDTAFHRDMPDLAQRFALPAPLHASGLRRYGFHGLACEAVACALPALDARAAAGRTVILHLGAGASMTALRAGRSICNTMGFSALDGLPMATRSGALDPGVLLHLMQAHHLDAAALERLLYRESGLLGVSGLSGDMRDLLASDAPGARLAIDLFVYRIARELGSLAAALGGLDAMVFTGGIGEHAPEIRARVCDASAWLGVKLDSRANRRGGPRISRVRSKVAVWVQAADEARVIAGHVQRLIAGPAIPA
ncbi:MAG TPA: acetate kinase [Burkholderiales bacterium]